MLDILKALIILCGYAHCTLYCDMRCTKNISSRTNRYRTLKLDNDMTILLIHDEKFSHSSIQMIIDAGSIYNDDDLNIQAHLVEHLFLQQCSKYPMSTNINFFVFNKSNGIASTALERIKINMTVPNPLLPKTINWLATILSNPLFDEEHCINELKILKQEHYFRNHDATFVIQDLYKSVLSESVHEQRNIEKIESKLSATDLKKRVETFYKKYYTGERIIMVLASNISLDEMEKQARMFNCIKKGELKADIHEKSTDIKFNDKYLAESLIQDPLEGYLLKPEFRGSLVKFYSFRYINMFYLRIVIPSVAKLYEYKLLEYFKEVLIGKMRDPIKDKLIEANLIKSLNLEIIRTRRITYFTINALLPNETNDEMIKKLIIMIYEWMISHKPSTIVFDYIKLQEQKSFKESNDVIEVANSHIESMHLYSCFDPVYVHKVFIYSSTEITKFFLQLQDINNWTAFLGIANNQDLNRTSDDNNVEYSDPIPMNEIVKDVEINPEYSNLEKQLDVIETPQYSDNKLTFMNFVKRCNREMEIKHKKLSKGEYTIMSSNVTFNCECEVCIDFVFEPNHLVIFNAEMFFTLYKFMLDETLKKDTIDVEIVVSNQNFYCLSIRFSGDLSDIVSISKFAGNLFNDIKVAQRTVGLLKEQFERIYTLSNYSKPADIANDLFRCYMKQTKVYKRTTFNEATGICPKEYYLNIKGYGKIDEESIKTIYECFESRAETIDTLKNNIAITDVIFPYFQYDPNTGCQVVVFGYEVDTTVYESCSVENPVTEVAQTSTEFGLNFDQCILKNYVAGLFLKKILFKPLFEHVRHKHQLLYTFFIDLSFIHRRLFLTFSLISTFDIEVIKRSFCDGFISSYKEMIENTDDEFFEDVRCSVLDSITNYDDINRMNLGLDLYADLYSQYGNDLFDRLKTEINRMSKKSLLELNMFAEEPIIASAKAKYAFK